MYSTRQDPGFMERWFKFTNGGGGAHFVHMKKTILTKNGVEGIPHTPFEWPLQLSTSMSRLIASMY